ncbi:hypothetical protein JCM3766R1_005553 [Sporobolomyces carnicolor]
MTDEASTDPKYPLGKLEQSLASNELISIRETLALVTQLGQDIERDIDQIRAGLLHLTEMTLDDPWSLLRVLASCHRVRSARTKSRQVFCQVCAVSNPKELVLALEELLAQSKFVCGDDDDDDRSRESGTELCLFVTLVRAYRICLERLETNKFDMFYSTAFESVAAVTIHFVALGRIPLSPGRGAPQDQDEAQTDDLCLDLLESMLLLAGQVAAIRDGEQRRKARESARSFLATIFGVVSSRFPRENAYHLFVESNPRYRTMNANDTSTEAEERIWTTVFPETFAAVEYKLDELVVACRFSESPLKRVGSLSLLSRHLACRPVDVTINDLYYDDDDDEENEDVDDRSTTTTRAAASFVLSATLETILRSLNPNGAHILAADDVLFLLSWTIKDHSKRVKVEQGGRVVAPPRGGFEPRLVVPLVKILSHLSALSPNDRIRFVAFRLLSTVVIEYCGGGDALHGSSSSSPSEDEEEEATRLALVKSLVSKDDHDDDEDGVSTPALRTASIAIVKELFDDMLGSLETNSRSKRQAVDNVHLDELSRSSRPELWFRQLEPILFRLDDPSFAVRTSSNAAAADFIELGQHRDVSQKLNLYLFLLTRDRLDQTGVRSASSMRSIRNRFLEPLQKRLTIWLGSSPDPVDDDDDHGATAVRLELELLQVSLSRIDQVVERLSRSTVVV